MIKDRGKGYTSAVTLRLAEGLLADKVCCSGDESLWWGGYMPEWASGGSESGVREK
ncbi:MAG: hypothetical protein GX767_03430 [Firmicutes bacterium]|nr:hypothetical protein [Bacillota bacterium]